MIKWRRPNLLFAIFFALYVCFISLPLQTFAEPLPTREKELLNAFYYCVAKSTGYATSAVDNRLSTISVEQINSGKLFGNSIPFGVSAAWDSSNQTPESYNTSDVLRDLTSGGLNVAGCASTPVGTLKVLFGGTQGYIDAFVKTYFQENGSGNYSPRPENANKTYKDIGFLTMIESKIKEKTGEDWPIKPSKEDFHASLRSQFERCFKEEQNGPITFGDKKYNYNSERSAKADSMIGVGLLVNPYAGPSGYPGVWTCKELKEAIEQNKVGGADLTAGTATIAGRKGDEKQCSTSVPFVGDFICNLGKVLYAAVSTSYIYVLGTVADSGDTFNIIGKNGSEYMKMWALIRNIANIFFVLAFAMVIFQYMANLNVVDAYFIKKFLPRLIVAVVLTQASFFIVSEMNRVVTALGNSVPAILQVADGTTGSSTATTASKDIGAAAEVGVGPSGKSIAFGALSGVLGVASLGLFVIMFVVLLVVMIVSFVVLAMRQVLLVALALAAPLAFAALSIPQLSSWTKKWFGMYFKLLMMYPIIMFMVALSNILGPAVQSMGGIYTLLALIAYSAPILMIPFTFKMGGALMAGAVALGAKAGKFVGGKAAEHTGITPRYKAWKEGGQQRRAERAQVGERGRRIRQLERKGNLNERDKTELAIKRAETAQHALRGESAEEASRGIEAKAAQLHWQKFREQDPTRAGAINEAMRIVGNKNQSQAMRQAAFAELVNQKAVPEMEMLQNAAASARAGESAGFKYNNMDGSIDATTYNLGQGTNYSTLKGYAAHLINDVTPEETTSDPGLQKHFKESFSALTNSQLATQRGAAWKQYAKVNPQEAMKRYEEIKAAGGTAAENLAPDAYRQILDGFSAPSGSQWRFDGSGPTPPPPTGPRYEGEGGPTPPPRPPQDQG